MKVVYTEAHLGHNPQEEIAESLGVSRQPVQQALLLLRSDGLVRDASGRGLIVAPLELDFVREVFEVV